MRMKGLTLERIPPADVPFQFFLVAPWFGVLGAMVVLFSGQGLWANPWNPALIGVTHLMTLGFITMVMLGALFQLLPVLSGESIPAATAVSRMTQLLLIAGLICLSFGFISGTYYLAGLAVPLLGISLITFIVAIGSRLVTNIRGGDSIHAIRLAVLALLVTIGLGSYRALSYLYHFDSVPGLTALHVSWGLLGWVSVLIMGVSFQVIPMFHVTPNYPSAVARIVPGLLIADLLLISFSRSSAAINGLALIMGIAIVVYAGYSLALLQRRKRKVMDVTVRFWQFGLTNLVLAVLLAGLIFYRPQAFSLTAFPPTGLILVGVLMILGFACSVIMGMMQKIVPFLIYLHLQRSCLANISAIKRLPHMHLVISADRSNWQLRFHAIAVVTTLTAVMYNPLTLIAALALLLDFSWLAFLATRAMWLYTETKRKLVTNKVNACTLNAAGPG